MMTTRQPRLFGGLTAAVLIMTAGVTAHARTTHVPRKVTRAIEKLLPDSTVQSCSRMTRDGRVYYNVTLRWIGSTAKVRASAAGVLDNIELRSPGEDIPADLQESIAQMRRNGAKVTITRRERGAGARRRKALDGPAVYQEISISPAPSPWLIPVGGEAPRKVKLPPKVEATITRSFPGATVISLERERENGVRINEVNLKRNGLRIEVEVDRYGNIGEVERRVDPEDLPAELARTVARVTKRKGVKIRIERHERWGRARNGRFVQLRKPKVFYQVKIRGARRRRSINWRPSGEHALSAKVAAAARRKYPRGVVTEVEPVTKEGVDAYEVKLILDGQDIEATFASGGALVEETTDGDIRSLPDAVIEVLAKKAPRAQIVRLEKDRLFAVTDNGKLSRLDPPEVVYEIRLLRGRARGAIEVSEDGKVVEDIEWDGPHDDDIGDDPEDDDDDHDDDDDDD